MRTNIISIVTAIERDKLKLKKNGILSNGVMDIRYRPFKNKPYEALIDFIDSYEPLQEQVRETGIACYVKDLPPSGDYFSFFIVVAENHPLFNIALLKDLNFGVNILNESGFSKMISGLFNRNRTLDGLVVT